MALDGQNLTPPHPAPQPGSAALAGPDSRAGDARAARIEGMIQTLIMLAIGGAAGAASFRHVHDVAAAHGQPGWLAWCDAVTLEAASIAAGLDLRRRKRVGKPVVFPAATLTAAVALSLSAQVVEAQASVIGWLAAALPALGFLAMVKMALGRADPGPATVGSGLVPVEAGPAPASPGLVPAQPGTAHTRPTVGAEVAALVPAARTAAEVLASQGVALSRTSLAAQLRAEGHALSTATATELLRQLRTEPITAPAVLSLATSGPVTEPVEPVNDPADADHCNAEPADAIPIPPDRSLRKARQP